MTEISEKPQEIDVQTHQEQERQVGRTHVRLRPAPRATAAGAVTL